MGMIQVMQSLLNAQPHQESVTATDGIVTFDTDFKAPMKVVIPFEPVQEGTGDPSPDNVRPISGWTGCEIYRAGDNILFEPPIRQINNCAPESEGLLKGSNYYNTLVFPIPKGVLYLHKNANGSDLTVGFSNNPSLVIGDSTEDALHTKWGVDYQYTNNDYKYAYVTMARNSATPHFSISTQDYLTGIDYGQGQSISITFTDPSTGDPLTVYGGTVTLNEDESADLVVPNASRVYDNEENILTTYLSSGYYNLSRIPYLLSNWQRPLYCSHYKLGGNPGIIGGNNSAFWIRGYDYTNTEGFRDYLRQQAQNGTPLCVVWKMATPLTYHFDNIGQLKSFLGTNNIWSDLNGDPTVTYWKHG